MDGCACEYVSVRVRAWKRASAGHATQRVRGTQKCDKKCNQLHQQCCSRQSGPACEHEQ
jgi:hypothetical protein